VNSGTRSQSGLTLLEVLVVLVLVGLLSTLLMQGIGYFLGKYHAVRRYQYVASMEARQQHWFTQSLQGLIPYRSSTRTFSGSSSSFEGISMQALSEVPGLPVKVTWSLQSPINSFSILTYQEAGLEPWEIGGNLDTDMAFFYADESGRWYSDWPPEESIDEKIPSMIKLAADQGKLHWLVHLPLFPKPVTNFTNAF
jgi:general secretion pathway protein J